jgi:hypothetical protein
LPTCRGMDISRELVAIYGTWAKILTCIDELSVSRWGSSDRVKVGIAATKKCEDALTERKEQT